MRNIVLRFILFYDVDMLQQFHQNLLRQSYTNITFTFQNQHLPLTQIKLLLNYTNDSNCR